MKITFRRSYIAAIHDIMMAAISFPLSIYLRLGELSVFNNNLLFQTLVFSIISSFIFFTFKLYNNLWGYASLKDLSAISKSVTISILLFFIILFFINRLENIPRSLFIINWLLLLFLLGGPRFIYRYVRERKNWLNELLGHIDHNKISVLLIGLNNNTELFIREIARAKNSNYKIVGIIDDNLSRVGSKIHNVKILGATKHIDYIYHKLKHKNQTPQKLLITEDFIEQDKIKELLHIADELGMSLAKLPRLTDFKDDNLETIVIKHLVIEDLLGRSQNIHNKHNISEIFSGKRILITGCGGSIGRELTRQIAEQNPSMLILVDICEYNLYEINNEISTNFPHLSKKVIIADIRNENLIAKIFNEIKPELVFHAAALKHVPLVEENICEAIATNLFGTKIITDQSIKHQAKMVMISTDKAVNPTNIMGATKRAAEIYIQSVSKDNQVSMVRFGNVLGSSGSVIPLFEQQLKKGGPLTVTHPDMVRYFMTIREAVELVLQSSAIKLDDRGRIFVLDMGSPVKINDLAKQMIQMAGFRVDIDIKIEYSGIRAGEKLFEELSSKDEELIKTNHEAIMLVKNLNDSDCINLLMNDISQACNNYNVKESISLLQRIVPEYKTHIDS